jgi:hypothetical protein
MSKEMEVRAGLMSRPAGVLYRLVRGDEDHPYRTFMSLFHGAIQGRLWGKGDDADSAFFGKAEAEWGWPHDWKTLKEAGLVEYEIKEDGTIPWRVTELARTIYEDNRAYNKELGEAIEADGGIF